MVQVTQDNGLKKRCHSIVLVSYNFSFFILEVPLQMV